MRIGCLLLVAMTGLSGGAIGWVPPYAQIPSEEVDSSEDGGPPGPVPTTCPCGVVNKVSPKIIGGKATGVNQYPFAVMLTLRGSGPFCGGTIITEYHVLTAGHCVIKYRQYGIQVVAGDHDHTTDRDTASRVTVNVKQVIIHENYPTEKNYDIAILRTDRRIPFGRNIGKICLPHKRLTLDYQYVKAIGWGKTSPYGWPSNFLRKANVRVVPASVCRHYSGIIYTDLHQMCTFSKGKGLGQGDSGGPLVWVDKRTNRYTIVGIPSYVYLYNGTVNTYPDVSVDVSTFLVWILDVIKATEPSAWACWASK
uniref:Venom S1 protease 21 n=1 Tax=Lethocerus distinctifemur TaxID=280095 RepID=A0A2K8JRF3_9HEMI|nr:venom S1 protease 21 [Lethocerus distinctifemur]